MSLNSSLLRLKLLDSLRSGDPAKVDQIVSELDPQDKLTILHYAVQVAPLSIIKHVVSKNIDVNVRDSQGNTPLHLAAAAARLDVVKYLLSLSSINDTIVNLEKKQPVEVTLNINVAQLMQIERAKYVESSATALRNSFLARDFEALEDLLVLNPRSLELLDINGADPSSGNTVFHEFILANDVEMCDWILKHGGDPFKRDKKGRLPIDLASKNDPLKRLIKGASKEQTINVPAADAQGSSAAPTYKGYLRKWTNFAGGYKLRYFVLDSNGILSYYTNQDDTTNACRGSLNLGYATLHLDSSEKLKFEIIGKNGIRWHLKANHPTETNRWVWTLQNAATLAKDNIKGKRGPSESENIGEDSSKSHHLKILSRKSSKHKKNASNTSNSSATVVGGTAAAAAAAAAGGVTEGTNAPTNSGNNSTGALAVPHDHDDTASKLSRTSVNSTPANIASLHDNYSYDAENFDRDDEDDDDDSLNENSAHNSNSANINDLLATLKRSLNVEIHSLQELFQQYNLDTTDPGRKQEICSAGLNTTSVIQDLINKFENLVIARDTKLNRQLERQLEVNKLWENSITQLENEIRKREIKLSEYEGKKQKLKKYLTAKSGSTTSKNLGPGGLIGLDTGVNRSTKTNESDTFVDDLLQDSDGDEFFDAGDFDDDDFDTRSSAASVLSMTAPVPFQGQHNELADDSQDDYETKQDHIQHPAVVSPNQGEPASGEAEIPETIAEVPEKQDSLQQITPGRSEHYNNENTQREPIYNRETVDADQIHREGSVDQDDPISGGHDSVAIAAGVAGGAVTGGAAAAVAKSKETPQEAHSKTKENKSQPPIEPEQKVSVDGLNDIQAKHAKIITEENTFVGYEDPPRTKLAIDEDNRPKVGLWGILKSMIGKDMTKMTLPVAFNEPTSLLQRLSEDIECSYLLDKAATFDDSTLRMIYVAGFAASEYASASGRIAKPFNPLLGETFEYCRPELNYRLLTEQVSHHPPISACSVQAPKWDYYGENAVDSKFTGRSFDIKHLGKMFCALRPDNGVIDSKGNQVSEELYSWKKVNTAVVGIIVGSPTVDNYGLMEVTNHTTGDTMAVDLKQRGWKASSAYQLSGHSVDKKGVPQWAIGGRWNSKIYGKKIKSGNSLDKARRNSLLEDQPKVTTEDPYSGQKFLLWQVAPRPKVPFNLTSFATSLNDPNPKLVKWIAPTDTRLRPDQRAMEEGEYDKASSEKNRVEEKQRAAKRARDSKKEVYKPNWFVKKKHPVTGDNYWEFQGDYWNLRGQQQLKGVADIF